MAWCLQKASEAYPETAPILTIPGVGPLTAWTLVLLLNNDKRRLFRSRDQKAQVRQAMADFVTVFDDPDWPAFRNAGVMIPWCSFCRQP